MDKVLMAIATYPGADYPSLALAAYGQVTEENLHRLRSAIHTLKSKRRIKLVAGADRGRWETTQNGAGSMS
jgi:hypothetical protein